MPYLQSYDSFLGFLRILLNTFFLEMWTCKTNEMKAHKQELANLIDVKLRNRCIFIDTYI